MNIGPGGPNNNPFFRPTLSGPPLGIDVGGEGPLTPSELLGSLLSAVVLSQQGLSQDAILQTSLSTAQMSQFLKNLLQLPKEIEQLLSMLSTEKDNPATQLLSQLIAQNPELSVSLDNLEALLKQAFKQGEGKLLQLLQNSANSQRSGDQSMGDMMNLLTQLGSSISSSKAELLNTTLLLYLPWHPLAENQKLTLHFPQAPMTSNNDGETDDVLAGGGQVDTSHLVLLIETRNLGRFKITIMQLHATQLFFQIDHSALAEKSLPLIEQNTFEALNKSGLPKPQFSYQAQPVIASATNSAQTPTALQETTVANNSQPETSEANKTALQPDQSVIVQSGAQTPVIVVQGAYWITRIIFERDNHLTLDESRARQLN